MSRDVVFHEHIFLFSKSFKSKIKRPVPAPIAEVDARCLDIDLPIDDQIAKRSLASSTQPSPSTEAEVSVAATSPSLSPDQHHSAQDMPVRASSRIIKRPS